MPQFSGILLSIKREFCERQFLSDEEVTNAVQMFLRSLSPDQFEKIIIKKWKNEYEN